MAAYSRSLRPLFIATTASLSWLTTTIIYFFSCSCFMFPGRSRRNCPVFDIQRGIHKHPRQKWKNRSFIILLNVADSLSVFYFCLFVFVLFCFLVLLFFFYFLCLFLSSFKLPQSHWFCRLYVPGKKISGLVLRQGQKKPTRYVQLWRSTHLEQFAFNWSFPSSTPKLSCWTWKLCAYFITPT